MVRTGRRAEVLRDLLVEAGLRTVAAAPPWPSGVAYLDELLELYRRLGGLQDTPSLRPGGWDLIFDDRLVVELDEELHFNRYRAITLETSWSRDLPWTEDYQRYCVARESECLAAGRWGKRWTNDSCARMFSGGRAGDLSGEGAPRWKQRALYDAIKDMAPAGEVDMALVRVSVYDRIGDAPLGSILDGYASAAPASVAELVRARAAPPRAL